MEGKDVDGYEPAANLFELFHDLGVQIRAAMTIVELLLSRNKKDAGKRTSRFLEAISRLLEAFDKAITAKDDVFLKIRGKTELSRNSIASELSEQKWEHVRREISGLIVSLFLLQMRIQEKIIRTNHAP